MEDEFKSVGDILRSILPKEVFDTPAIPREEEFQVAMNFWDCDAMNGVEYDEPVDLDL
tara:strand:+ start:562 stop:735 length:174 start_codon:yes stop_codon:yes gene_type:complete